MKHVLIYILFSVSMAVLAQQQVDQDDVVKNENETSGSVEEYSENKPQEQSDETDPSDKDFKPSEEISEDFPVPLPSDI